MVEKKGCPYIEAAFKIIGKKWNGQVIHFLSLCENQTAHFSEIKQSIGGITSAALSTKLTELVENELVEKIVENGSSIKIYYKLTEKGLSLSNSFKPIQEWAINFSILEVRENDE